MKGFKFAQPSHGLLWISAAGQFGALAARYWFPPSKWQLYAQGGASLLAIVAAFQMTSQPIRFLGQRHRELQVIHAVHERELRQLIDQASKPPTR